MIISKIKILVIVFLTLCVISILGCSNTKTEKGHKSDEHHEEENEIGLTLHKDEIEEFGIVIEKVNSGTISTEIQLPGEITINEDKLAHIVPRFAGNVIKVNVSLGDNVKKNQVLAVISSRELADSKAEYLASLERTKLAEAVAKREEVLMEKQITSKQEFLDAKKAFVEAKINLKVAEQKLHSFGFSEAYLKSLNSNNDEDFTKYEIKSPFDGTILEKHITLGENIHEENEIFNIADLKTVWVNLTVFPKYLHYLKANQVVILNLGNGFGKVKGKIDFITPVVGEKTRTATARVILSNDLGNLKPGAFINAVVEVEKKQCEIVVPLSAIQKIEGKDSVFVKHKDDFDVKHIKTGRKDSNFVEVISGINKGDKIVTKGSFTLKAQLEKGSISAEHSH